jgi:uncharacterized membrane protein (UPF0127 family)
LTITVPYVYTLHMSLNKIIIGFIVILLLFSAYIVFQIDKTPKPPSKVTIDNQTFSVELARTTKEQEQGLSGRTTLPQDQGMLFSFKTSAQYPFWMKGMKIPLDILFIKDDKIVTIFNSVPPPKDSKTTNLPVYTPTKPVNYALELNAGQAKTYDFQNGDDVKIVVK